MKQLEILWNYLKTQTNDYLIQTLSMPDEIPKNKNGIISLYLSQTGEQNRLSPIYQQNITIVVRCKETSQSYYAMKMLENLLENKQIDELFNIHAINSWNKQGIDPQGNDLFSATYRITTLK